MMIDGLEWLTARVLMPTTGNPRDHYASALRLVRGSFVEVVVSLDGEVEETP